MELVENSIISQITRMQQCFLNNWMKLVKGMFAVEARLLSWGIWFAVEMRSFHISCFLPDVNFASSCFDNHGNFRNMIPRKPKSNCTL